MAPTVATPPALQFGDYALVDLTHAYNAQTIYWPTSPTAFSLETLSKGVTPGGWYYSANSYASPEHGGTHLDAPVHFGEGQHATEQIPLEQLMAPAVVIDIRAAATANPDYELSLDDVLAFEAAHGRIAPGTIVLLRTGWSARWPDRKAYLGDDTPNDASRLHFPSFGAEAARLLVDDRDVAVLGADVASVDIGQSQDFRVHRIAAAKQVPGLENLTQLEALPATGAYVIALPMKIEGGSGGPLRAVAMVPRTK